MLILHWLLSLQLLAAGPEAIPVPQDSGKPAADTLKSPKAVTDTNKKAAPVQVDTSLRKPAPAKPRAAPQKPPGIAMLLSALVPGGGQYYTHNTVKGIIYGAAELTLAGFDIREDQQLRKAYREAWPDTLVRRDRRNALLWWTAAVWAFTIADAYVDANMYGFKEEQRLTLGVAPLEVSLNYRF